MFLYGIYQWHYKITGVNARVRSTSPEQNEQVYFLKFSIDGKLFIGTRRGLNAIDAIRMSAFDYLVKPIEVKELQNSVERLISQYKLQTTERMDILLQNLKNSKSQEDKIGISTNDGLEFLQIKNIIRIESSSNYSKIFLTDDHSIVVTKLLKEFEEILVPYRFYRVHNSHLINLNYIRKYMRGDGGQVVMQNGDLIDVARRKKDEFMQILTGHS